MGWVADYVTDSELDSWRGTFQQQFEWISRYLKKACNDFVEIDKVKHKITLKKGFKSQHFKPRFEDFKRLVNELTFEEFSTMKGLNTLYIENYLNDKYTFYLYDEYPLTIDEYFRRRLSDDKEKVLTIIQDFDYHY